MPRIIGQAALLLALVAPAAVSQAAASADHPSHHAQSQAPKLDAELAEHFKGITLTAEQVKRVTEIKAKHHRAMEALKKDAKDLDDPSLKAGLQKHMDAEHAEFKALLTPEQAKAFEANMKAHHAAGGKHEMKDGMKHEGMKHDPKPAPRKPR